MCVCVCVYLSIYQSRALSSYFLYKNSFLFPEENEGMALTASQLQQETRKLICSSEYVRMYAQDNNCTSIIICISVYIFISIFFLFLRAVYQGVRKKMQKKGSDKT